MDLKLKDKVVVVTGGSAGIGKAAALAFAAEGCRVAICGRSQAKLDAASRELEAAGATFMAEAVDVADMAAVQAFADAVCAQFGAIDVWVNNAGVNRAKPVLQFTPEDWDMIMDVNLKGVFFASQYVAKIMIERKIQGVIINLSSFATVIPSAGRAIYAASKNGVNALTRTFAAELAPHGIRVLGVIPGMIETDMTQQHVAAHRAALVADVAAGRLGVPEDLARPIVFLASEASSYITGVCVEVSGGKFSVQNPGGVWAAQP